MRLFKNSILAGALTIALAGCVGMEKDTAAEMTPEGSAFNQALYAEYLGRSQVEFAEGDYGNSDLFGLKAQWAAGDAFVVPEKPGDHALPEGSVAELEDVIARFRRFGTAHTSVVLSSPVTDKPAAAP